MFRYGRTIEVKVGSGKPFPIPDGAALVGRIGEMRICAMNDGGRLLVLPVEFYEK